MAVIKLYASRYGSLALSTNQQNAEVLKRGLAQLTIIGIKQLGPEGAARLFSVAMDLYYMVKGSTGMLGFLTCGEYTPEKGDGTVLLAEIDSAELASKVMN